MTYEDEQQKRNEKYNYLIATGVPPKEAAATAGIDVPQGIPYALTDTPPVDLGVNPVAGPTTKSPAVPQSTEPVTTADKTEESKKKFMSAVSGLGGYARKTNQMVESVGEQLKDATGMQINSIMEQSNIADIASKEQLAALKKHQDNLQSFKSYKNAWRVKETEILDKQAKKVKELMQTDPNRLLKSKVVTPITTVDPVTGKKTTEEKVTYETSIGKTIGAALLVGVGEFAKSLQQLGGNQGARNLAKEVIDDKIRRDIEAQKDAADAEITLYGENLRRFGSEQQAMEATELQLQQAYAQELEKIALKHKGQEVAAKAEGLIGDLRAGMAEKEGNLKKLALDAGMQEAKYAGEMGLEREKLELMKGGGQKPIPAEVSKQIAMVDTALQRLDAVEFAYRNLNDMTGVNARKFDDMVTTSIPITGKAVMGEAFNEGDKKTWAAGYPTTYDSKERGLEKLKNTRQTLLNKKQDLVRNLTEGPSVEKTFKTGPAL
jgi:hypothetical protein